MSRLVLLHPAGALHVLWQQAQPAVRPRCIATCSHWGPVSWNMFGYRATQTPRERCAPRMARAGAASARKPSVSNYPPPLEPLAPPHPLQAARCPGAHAPAGPDRRLVGQAQGPLLHPRVQRHHLRALPAGGEAGLLAGAFFMCLHSGPGTITYEHYLRVGRRFVLQLVGGSGPADCVRGRWHPLHTSATCRRASNIRLVPH